MERLIKKFKSEADEVWQEAYLEHESELLMNQHGYSFNQSKMRGALLGWVASIVEPYGYQVDTLDGKIQVELADKSMSIEWTEADKLLDIIESVKSEEAMKKLWEGME